MFRAVDNRCAVNLKELDLIIPVDQAIEILEERGFRIYTCDIIELARQYVGFSRYKLGARQHQAPQIFDCSSFTKWLHGQLGIKLPRRSIQQFEFGIPIRPNYLRAGDLIFTTGKHHSWYRHDPKVNIGHVGIISGENTVIHAAGSKQGVIETHLAHFLEEQSFRGIRRIIPDPDNTLFFKTPKDREIESSDDFFWVIVQTL